MEKNYKKNIEAKMKLEENKTCADCNQKNPRWVSCKYGIFICLECAGLHRSLGINYDIIKSSTLDQWNKESYLPIKYGGNSKFHAYLQANSIKITNILDKYKNNVVIQYSIDLINEIKNETGIDLSHTNIGINFSQKVNTSNDNFISHTTSLTSPNYTYKTNNDYKKDYLTSAKIIGSNIKNKLMQYSPKIMDISSNTMNKIAGMSTILLKKTKEIKDKTFDISSKIVSNTNNSPQLTSKVNLNTKYYNMKKESKDWT
ncbi:GTPase-activating protein [Enterocytozoon bieneusi H348]|nr:GTPase-activating protein [Enterocytozoon bieneusi H348]|eukprot:XP_002650137.1 GTPase-activating protein [Enterocytozoon bieneusi H348]